MEKSQRHSGMTWPAVLRRAAIAAAALAALAVAALAMAGPAMARNARATRGQSAGPSAGPSAKPAVHQLITVRASAHSATRATLRVYEVTSRRKLIFGPWTARVGYKGIAPKGKKREGDGRTPSGTFSIGFFFGVQRGLGFAFPFRHAFRYDYWDDDPSSPRYNEWVDARKQNPGADPEPMHQVPAYDYAAVIGYNTARVPGLGSAIFLHVGTGSATAGCVSLPRRELISLLRWLRPRYHPRITISAG